MNRNKFIKKTAEIVNYTQGMGCCPRCEKKLNYDNYGGDDGFTHFHVNCTNLECKFKIDVTLLFTSAYGNNDDIWEFDRDKEMLCGNNLKGERIEYPMNDCLK